MKKLIKLVLFLMVAYPLTGAILSACSEESDCSMTGRPDGLRQNVYHQSGNQGCTE